MLKIQNNNSLVNSFLDDYSDMILGRLNIMALKIKTTFQLN